jgi:GNAT superfamily N-acetyltransferase
VLKTYPVVIKPFEPAFQEPVERLVLPIQQIEFGVPITREQQPDLMDIAGTFQKGAGNFWVALDGENVVGTIGVVDISNQQVALKKMFVAGTHRGKDKGISQMLMDTALAWCRSRGIQQVLLGTTARMFAAYRFYEKNGFVELTVSDLPPLFPVVSVDTKFYCRTL